MTTNQVWIYSALALVRSPKPPRRHLAAEAGGAKALCGVVVSDPVRERGAHLSTADDCARCLSRQKAKP